MKQATPKRYVARNAQLGQDTNLGKIRDPWKVIDTTTNRIVDEFTSGRAARSAAAYYNRYGVPGAVSPIERT